LAISIIVVGIAGGMPAGIIGVSIAAIFIANDIYNAYNACSI